MTTALPGADAPADAIGGDDGVPTWAHEAPGADAPGAAGRFAVGTMIAERYRVGRLLGRGGMGEVYRADDLVLGQTVALKFLPQGLQDYFKRHLLHEARVARQITHPNVCRVYDIGKAEKRLFLSMEYIDGEDLASLLARSGRLTPENTVTIGLGVCHGLAAAHAQGILHRDLKPANLMLDADGRVRVTDFGIAALAGTVEGLEIRRGTPAYMAPEQRAGQEVSVRSDIYSLGLVLYEALTGIRPAEWQNRDEAPEKPSRYAAGIDTDFERIVLLCLAADPDERPATVREVAEVLGRTVSQAWKPAAGRRVPQRPDWVLEKLLGKGGFGEVWLASHRREGLVPSGEQAAKTLLRVFKFCQDPSRLFALKRELTLFRLLREGLGERHDIVRIFDWEFDEPPYFIELEYVEGGSLLDWAESRGGIARVPLEQRLEIAAQVGEALAAAHSVAVLHKDIKPHNVLVRSGGPGPRIRLADFGIGRVLDEARLAEAGITLLGLTDTEVMASTALSGTLLYRAPELFEGKTATVQADVYSLGVLLYQLAVGDLGRVLGPGWERDVEDEILRADIAAAVDRSPARRLAGAGSLARRLRALEERREHRAAEEYARREAERHRRELERAVKRRRIVLAVLGAVLLATAIVLYQSRQLAREVKRRRDITRVAVAGEWLERDPTRAALVLLEVDRPDSVPYAASRMRRVLQHQLALFELRHGDDLSTVAWNPAGTMILTAAERDGTVRLSRADGRGPPTEIRVCEDLVTSAVRSSDGRYIAATCWNATTAIVRAGAAALEIATVLPARDSAVLGAAWSPDSRRLATTTAGGAVSIWRDVPVPGSRGPARFELTHELAGHAGLPGQVDVVTPTWSPDGRRLATASRDGTARIWDLEDRGAQGARVTEPTHIFRHEAGQRVWIAAWSPDGRRLATASNDATARVWHLEEGIPPVLLAGHRAGVRVVAWSPDGTKLLSASRDHTVRLWSSAGEPLYTYEGHENGLYSAAWKSNGRFILSAAEDGTARVWPVPDTAAGPLRDDLVLAGHETFVSAAVWSDDETRVLTMAGSVARVWIVDPEGERSGNSEPVVLRGHRAGVAMTAWSPDAGRIATASLDGTARVWQVEPPEGDAGGQRAPPIVLAGHTDKVVTAAWSTDGRRLLTASADGTARLWHLDRGTLAEPIIFRGHEGGLLDATFDPAGNRVLTVAGDGTARIRQADGRDELGILRGLENPIRRARWSPDGRHVVIAAATAVRLWSVSPGEERSDAVRILEEGGAEIRDAAWSADGDRLVTASRGGTARIWRLRPGADGNADTNDPVLLSHGSATPVLTAAFSPSGQRVVTGLNNGGVRVWPADGEAPPVILGGHRFAVTGAAFSPDGAWVLTSSADGEARIQPADGTGEPVVLTGHADLIESAAWSPRGDRVATASRDATARLWRPMTRDVQAFLRRSTQGCLDPEFREKSLGDAPEEARRRFWECESSYGRRRAGDP